MAAKTKTSLLRMITPATLRMNHRTPRHPNLRSAYPPGGSLRAVCFFLVTGNRRSRIRCAVWFHIRSDALTPLLSGKAVKLYWVATRVCVLEWEETVGSHVRRKPLPLLQRQAQIRRRPQQIRAARRAYQV